VRSENLGLIVFAIFTIHKTFGFVCSVSSEAGLIKLF